MHAGQLSVDAGTVHRLVHAQFPQWGALRVTRVPSAGTVNVLFRLGDELVARFPLRSEDEPVVRAQLEREASAAAELAGRLRWPTPRPVAIGEPGDGYPLPWAVQTWLPGEVAWGRPVTEALVTDLAELVIGLRALDTRGRTFAGTNRGGDLATHDEWVRYCLARSDGLFDVPRVARLWTRLRDLPRTAPDVMAHTDLTPGNLLLDPAGRLAGVLDVGGFGPADPALDVMVAWTMLDGPRRRRFRAAVGAGELDWERSRAWALEQAVGLVWYYRRTNPPMHHLGMRTIEHVLDGTGTNPDRGG